MPWRDVAFDVVSLDPGRWLADAPALAAEGHLQQVLAADSHLQQLGLAEGVGNPS